MALSTTITMMFSEYSQWLYDNTYFFIYIDYRHDHGACDYRYKKPKQHDRVIRNTHNYSRNFGLN